MSRVLIADDEPAMLGILQRLLTGMQCQVESAASGTEAQQKLAAIAFDLVITDLRMPGADGFAVLQSARELQPAVPVVILTAHGSMQDCVRAIRAGAFNFLGKPFHAGELEQVVRDAISRRVSPETVPVDGDTSQSQAVLIGESLQLRKMLAQVERVAPSKCPVLLVGEKATGKQAVARLLHVLAGQGGSPFVSIDCSQLGKDGWTSTLPQSGTLFLSGIDELGAALQATLIDKLRGVASGAHDVRVVVDVERAPASDASEATLATVLLRDFDGVTIALPPLRDRPEDLPLLAEYFLDASSRRLGRHVETPTRLISALQTYAWPGNLGELETRIARLVSEAPPPAQRPAVVHNELAVPVGRVAAVVWLHDGTRHDVQLPSGTGRAFDDFFDTGDPFVPVNEAGKHRMYARTSVACLALPSTPEIDEADLPRRTRAVSVRLRSGIVLEGELRYVIVAGRERVSDVLNEPSASFALYIAETVHHVCKAHVASVEER